MQAAFRCANALWASDVPGQYRHTLLALAVRINDKFTAWPSVARLASDTGASERKVRKDLAWAREAGIIRVVAKAGSTGRVNVYRWLLGVPADVADLKPRKKRKKRVILHEVQDLPRKCGTSFREMRHLVHPEDPREEEIFENGFPSMLEDLDGGSDSNAGGSAGARAGDRASGS